MKKIIQVVIIVSCLIFLMPGQSFAANIITNTSDSDCTSLDNWTKDSGTSWMASTSSGSLLSAKSPYDNIPGGGDEIFDYWDGGWESTSGQISLDVPISGYDAEIANGTLRLSASAYMYKSLETGTAQIKIEFYNGGILIEGGPYSATHSGTAESWYQGTINNITVPTGTTKVKVILSGDTGGGSSCFDFDGIEVNLSVPVPTVPTVTTGAAVSISSTAATLNGTVNANNSTSVVTFEYGTSTSYGSTATAAQSPVNGTSATSVSSVLTGLTPNTTYHFRVKAVNSGGTSYGSAVTFTTLAIPNAAPTISAIVDQTTNEDTAVGPLSIVVNDSGDNPTAAGSLTLSATSDNTTLLPAGSYSFGGSDADRTLTITPAANKFGTANITVTVEDEYNATATSTFVLTVNAVNDPPIAKNFTKTGNEDTNINFGMSDFKLNYTDVEGGFDSFTKAKFTGLPTNGTLLIGSALGLIPIELDVEILTDKLSFVTFKPNADWNGTTSFTWQGFDGTDYSADATVTITVNSVNDAPVAANSSITINENTAHTGNVTATDVESGTALTYSVVTAPAHGSSFILNVDGSYDYSPEINYIGTDNFTWKANDGTADSNTATVSITINAVVTDTAAPTGYSVAINQAAINNANKTAMSFTFADAEVGATYNYTVSSSGGAGSRTGSGTITSNDQQITGIDVSGLADGTLTLSVTLTDAAGNTGTASTDTVSKDTAAPAGYNVAIDQTAINNDNKAAMSFTFADAEVGAGYNYTVTSSGVGSVTGSGTISTANQQISGINVGGLSDGTLTLIVTLTDTFGNIGTTATATGSKDVTAPTGTISINNGAAITTSLDVTLSITSSDTGSGVNSMRFSFDEASWSPWQAVLSTRTSTLPTGYGLANVYMQLKDNAGNISGSIIDNIQCISQPAALNSTKNGTEDTTVSFTASDFPFSNDDGTPLDTVKINSLPANGTLRLESTPLSVTDEIEAGNLSQINFVPNANWYGSTSFKWAGYTADGLSTSEATLTITLTDDGDNSGYITGASVAITAPVVGAAPQNEAAVETATNNADYTVTGLVWNEALTAGNKFKAGQVYTATVTLTSKNSMKFQAGAFTPIAAGSESVGVTTTAGGDVVGNRVTFTVTYTATGALAVNSIAVTTQPSKIGYTETTDAVLALNGMQVTETNNDGSINVVTFTNGTASGYTTSPANGSTLTNAVHNGKPIVITHSASGKTANTNNLTVNKETSSGGGSSHSSTAADKPVIIVSEVTGELFSNARDINVEADVTGAFGQSVIVKLTDDTESQKEIFSLAGDNDRVYPFDISLYSKKSNEKIQPKEGYSVKITLPVPEELLDDREKIKVVYGKDGSLETLKSNLFKKDGKWYISFEAVHFSPYALIVSEEPAKPWTNPFSDVKEDDWYYSAVEYALQNGLMNGTESNIFSPGYATSRGMIATILYRLSGSTEISQSTFDDVNPGAYYANAVAWAQQKGIIAGYGNGMFGPDDSITREQLSTMLWKYAGSPAAADSNGLTNFQDAGEISSYAKNAMTWANQLGIINGKGEGLLDPKGKATRAEVAQIMQNFMQKPGLMK